MPFYVGITERLKRRDREHKHGKGKNKHLHNKLNKLQRIGHNICPILLAERLSRPCAGGCEKLLIRVIGRQEFCTGPLVNMTDGGDYVEGLSPESRAKCTAKTLEAMEKPTWKINQKEGAKKAAADPIYRESQRTTALARSATPEWQSKHREGIEKRSENTDWLSNIKTAAKKRSDDPVWKVNHIAAMEKMKADPEFQTMMSTRNKTMANDPVWRANHTAAMQKLSADPVWRANNKTAAQILSADSVWRANNKAAAQVLRADPAYQRKRRHDPPRKGGKYKGVHPKGNKWFALLSVNGVKHYRRGFATELEAARAYNEMVYQYQDGDGWLNRVDTIPVEIERREENKYVRD